MNKSTSRLLRKVCLNDDGTLNRSRYLTLKDNWKKVPWPARRPLLNAMFRAIGQTVPVTRAAVKRAATQAASILP